jgi:hypothetical protein
MLLAAPIQEDGAVAKFRWQHHQKNNVIKISQNQSKVMPSKMTKIC